MSEAGLRRAPLLSTADAPAPPPRPFSAKDYYELPLCDPEGRPKDAPANLGEILSADRYHSAPFQVHALVNETCTLMCELSSSKEDQQLRRALIMDAYNGRIRMDNMPAMFLDAKPSQNQVGLPLHRRNLRRSR